METNCQTRPDFIITYILPSCDFFYPKEWEPKKLKRKSDLNSFIFVNKSCKPNNRLVFNLQNKKILNLWLFKIIVNLPSREQLVLLIFESIIKKAHNRFMDDQKKLSYKTHH